MRPVKSCLTTEARRCLRPHHSVSQKWTAPFELVDDSRLEQNTSKFELSQNRRKLDVSKFERFMSKFEMKLSKSNEYPCGGEFRQLAHHVHVRDAKRERFLGFLMSLDASNVEPIASNLEGFTLKVELITSKAELLFAVAFSYAIQRGNSSL